MPLLLGVRLQKGVLLKATWQKSTKREHPHLSPVWVSLRFFGHHFSAARKSVRQKLQGLVSPRVGRTKSGLANNLHTGRGFFSGRKRKRKLSSVDGCVSLIGKSHPVPPLRCSPALCDVQSHLFVYFETLLSLFQPCCYPLAVLGEERGRMPKRAWEKSEFHYACEWILFVTLRSVCACVRVYIWVQMDLM